MNITPTEIRNKIGEHFDYSFNFDFIDLVELITTDALNWKSETEENDAFNRVYNAIDTYAWDNNDKWIIIQFYQNPEDANLNSAKDYLQTDIIQILNKLGIE